MTVSATSPMTRALLALLLALGLLTALAVPLTANAHAAPLRYVHGYSIQGAWLCYGWGNGAYHCTQHWRRSGSRVLSLNPAWVPNYGGYSTPAPASASAPVVHRSGGGNTAGYPFGQCTWGAARLSWDNVSFLGNAKDWIGNAIRRGLPTGSAPRVGATVVYQPFVQGASFLGHVAHVVAVYSNGRFEVAEMNYYGFGGGFGIFSDRLSHTGWGVSFIY